MHADLTRQYSEGDAPPRIPVRLPRIGWDSLPLISRLLPPRQLRFLAAGLLTVGADYGTFFVAYVILSAALGVATVASFLAGVVVSFGLNKLWVFRSSGARASSTAWQLLLYGLLLAFNIAVAYYLILGLEALLHVDPRAGKLISIGVITAWNYVLYGRIVFAERH